MALALFNRRPQFEFSDSPKRVMAPQPRALAARLVGQLGSVRVLLSQVRLDLRVDEPELRSACDRRSEILKPAAGQASEQSRECHLPTHEQHPGFAVLVSNEVPDVQTSDPTVLREERIAIDPLLGSYPKTRCDVRPSGSVTSAVSLRTAAKALGGKTTFSEEVVPSESVRIA